MLNAIKKAMIILMILPFYLIGGDLSIRMGINHSWLYYPDELVAKITENEFHPNVSLGLNTIVFSHGSFSSNYGVRFFFGRAIRYISI